MAKECVLSAGKLPLGGLPRNNVVKISNHLDMTSAVDSGRKASTQPTNIRKHGVQRRMISVDNFFVFLRLLFFALLLLYVT